MVPGVQEFIHRIEEGEGAAWVRRAFLLLLLLAATALWHFREAKSYNSIEAMDAAQIGHNLASGRGYTTGFIRPLSVAMIEKIRGEGIPVLKENHPDLANAPLYPAILAGLMKVLPFDWEMPAARFWRYQPEVLIGIFNQLLFFLAMYLVWKLGQELFDPAVAAFATLLFAGTELFWEFTTSGLSTMLLIVLFVQLVRVLARIERGGRETEPGRATGIRLGLAAGGLLGALVLTRYSMGWIAIPVIAFIALFGGARKGALAACAAAVFLLVLAPWLVRNFSVSGHAFGTAGTAIYQGTAQFPGERLERSLPGNIKRELNNIEFGQYPRKLFVNGASILKQDLPQMGGNWITAFFLAALLVPFLSPLLSRIRYFLLAALLTLVIAQALGRTYLSDSNRVLTSENLLVVVAPVLFLFGTALLFTLVDQIEFPMLIFRRVLLAGVAVLLLAPMILRLLPPRSYPYEYPPTAQQPYFPPAVQEISQWMEPDELMMSDMPWAVAWYGDRQAAWLTLDYGNATPSAFYHINDYQKAVKGLYLTPRTTDLRFLTEMLRSDEGAWGRFVLESILKTNVPAGFPLKKAPPGLFPEQLFLSDQTRWK